MEEPDWGYERCGDCGRPQRLAWSVTDEVWLKVTGKKQGILCLECFLRKADSKNIKIKKEDFTHLSIDGSIFIHVSPVKKGD